MSGIQSETKIVKGRTLVMTPYPAGLGLNIWFKLIKVIGPSIKSISPILKDANLTSLLNVKIEEFQENIDLELVINCIGDAIVKFSETSEPEEFVRLCLIILSSSRLDGQDINEQNFNMMFMKQYKLLFSVLKTVLIFNYSDFLEDTAKLDSDQNQDSTMNMKLAQTN